MINHIRIHFDNVLTIVIFLCRGLRKQNKEAEEADVEKNKCPEGTETPSNPGTIITPPFETIEDLGNQNDYLIAKMGGTAMVMALKVSCIFLVHASCEQLLPC